MRCSVTDLSPLGAEVHELKLEEATESDIEAVRLLLSHRGFVVLRDQHPDDQRFVTFLQRLGPMTFTVGETPVADEPMLNVVSNVGRSRPPRSVFHTDTSYISSPPAYTALRAVVLPESGGETLFTCQYRAFDSLPQRAVEELQGARVLHSATGVQLADSDESEWWQPLFVRHPLSGRVALYLSTPARCQRLSGFPPAEGQRLIELLYRHSTRRRRIYRHVWRAGDLMIWDNRCTLHRADHSKVSGDRVLHRGLVMGEPLELADLNELAALPAKEYS